MFCCCSGLDGELLADVEDDDGAVDVETDEDDDDFNI